MPLYGHELTEEIDPLQAGLGWAVKLNKGDFIGRDALLRFQQDKTRPVRVGLELEGKRIAREGTTVLSDGRPIGRVRAARSPRRCRRRWRWLTLSRRFRPWEPPCLWMCAASIEAARRRPPALLPPAENLGNSEDAMDPQKLRYAKTHEWASREGDVCTVGLTQFAVDQLTDVIYIELPDVGEPTNAGDSFGEIESVKSVNDLYAPVSGEVRRSMTRSTPIRRWCRKTLTARVGW